ncbi:hypothetical protein C7999DRAFT_41730 [Corynascus novoguineensis]|uniref:Uncharacterized protein n=1 Tax=Corynascus novoguineensis TaxID=1126955 RepID=A0AAN7CRE2_9PEZI|nr:hypothetical protein C7999DRAFT_41730 [Corynascus novoguineensis]
MFCTRPIVERINILLLAFSSFLQRQKIHNTSLSSPNKTAFSDLFWQLHSLEDQRPKGNPYIGGQNFTWCCLKAFENALGVNNGTVVIRDDSRSTIRASSVTSLQNAAKRNQFPCGAKYNNDLHGAPVVAINYDFLVEQCPSWELSSRNNLNAWLHSLSGFLLPAVIFCLSVPRRRKLYVFRSFFVADLAGIKSYVPAFLGALAAGLIVLLDTTIWLGMCFAFAGPMILSGLYEAMLDSRIIEFLREKIQNKRLTLDMRCRCLMLILIGNLDLALEPYNSQSLRPGTTASDTPTIRRRPTAHMAASPWRHMEVLLYDLRLYDDDDYTRSESPRQCARHLCEDAEHCEDNQHEERPRSWTLETKGHIARTKTRLRTMLHCQYSFGSVIGAPVVFFLGGFFFAFQSSLEHLGDEDIAESIAFGSWYMIIPHIAIVSGLLLAGNNPNILEGVFATEREDKADNDSISLLFGLLRFELVYPSCYKVAWQWQRGHTKKQWINQLLQTYSRRADVEYACQADTDDDDLENLRAKTNLSSLDWFLVLSLTFLLLGVPFVLAFLTSFFTPQTGLSCRSLTFAISFCIQVAQIGLWLWAYAGPPVALAEDATWPARGRWRGFHPLSFFRQGGWLDTNGFYTPTSVNWLLTENGRRRTVGEVVRSRELWSFRAMWCGIYYFLVVVFGFAAIFSSLGGTLMQIMGVYRTAMCYINVQYWLVPVEEKPMAILSTNSEEMIRNSINSSQRRSLTPKQWSAISMTPSSIATTPGVRGVT